MQSIKIGDAIDAENDGFAIYHELLLPVPPRGLDDPWITFGPVIAAPGDQAHGRSVPPQAQPLAVILHFVEPEKLVSLAGLFCGPP